MPILVNQTLRRQCNQHLIDMTTAERFLQGPSRFLDHFLDGELV